MTEVKSTSSPIYPVRCDASDEEKNIQNMAFQLQQLASEGSLQQLKDTLGTFVQLGYSVDQLITARTCSAAAQNRHFHILNWICVELFEGRPAPLDVWTPAFAAKNGHLDVIEWAVDKGCPVDEWTSYFAALDGHDVIVKWFQDKGYKQDLGLLKHYKSLWTAKQEREALKLQKQFAMETHKITGVIPTKTITKK